MRFGEDCDRQKDAVRQAGLDLRHALEDLSRTAKNAARRIASLDEVYAGTNAVRRAEEALDLATLDLATARGEDA